MSVLKDYEERNGLEPLTVEQVASEIEAAEAFLELFSDDGPPPRDRALNERLIVWLSDRNQDLAEALLTGEAPEVRCSWCWKAAGSTREAFHALPSMSPDGVRDHIRGCEHNPLVAELRRLEDRITELAATDGGEAALRRALGELVRR